MAAIKNRILIVDSDLAYAEELKKFLEGYGFHVETMASGTGALNVADAQQPSLVLLEHLLPDMRGSEVLSELKRNQFTRNIPVMMHSKNDEQVDRIVSLELGAEDYVLKPCDFRELLLRIKRAMIRISLHILSPDEIRVGQLCVIRSKAQVTAAGCSVRLSAMELKLLVVLMERCGRLQSRERLLADIWGYQVSAKSRTLDTHIKRLRDKLGMAGEYIETIRNIGFRMKEIEPQELLAIAPRATVSPFPSKVSTSRKRSAKAAASLQAA